MLIGCPVAPGMAMTLEEAVKLAVDSHPQVLAFHKAQAVAEQEIGEARARYFPEVNTRVGVGIQSVNNNTTRFRRTRGTGGPSHVGVLRQDGSVTVNQMLFDGFETPNLVDAARYRFDTSGHQVTDVEEAIALAVIEAFFEVQRSREVIALAEDNVQTHVEVLDDVTLRAQTGAGNQADVVQAQSRLALARTRLTEQEGLLRDAEADFIEAVGVPPDDLIVGNYPSEWVPKTLQDAITRAVAENPAALAARTAVEARRSDAKAAEGVFVPRFDIELSATGENNVNGVRGSGTDLAALLVMRFNLYRGGGDSAILRGAREQVSKTIMDERATRRLVEEQTRLDWSRLETAQSRLPNVEERVINSAQVVSAYRQQFELGQRTLLDVLDTENELFQARVDLVSAEYDVHFAHWAVISTLGQTTEAMGIHPETPEGFDEMSDEPPVFLLAPRDH